MTLARPSHDQMSASGRNGRAEYVTVARSRLPVSAVALIAAAGVLIVAAAYTAGRLGYASSPWANRTYWLGQVLIIAPVGARLLSRRRLDVSETVTLLVILTVAEYLVKICYSPTGFTFGDELMHWRSTMNILQTGKLFRPNDLLPISPFYPGLEEVTAALISVTGLSVFAAGLIVVGIAHLAYVLLLYLIFQQIASSHRVSGVAVLIYASNPLFQSFDSMFVYQTLALTFLGLAVLAAKHLAAWKTARDRAGWLTIALLATSATVVTHNVTSYVLVAALEVITLGSLLARSRLSAAWASLLALAASAAFTAWIVFVAPSTVSYIQPVLTSAVQAFKGLFASGHSSGMSATVGPLGDEALSAAAVLAISVLLPVGWRHAWRHYRQQPWVMAMAIGSVTWYILVAVRLFVPDGTELAGRTATFVYVPTGFIAALAVIRLTDNSLRWPVIRANARKRAPLVVAVAVIGAVMFIFDGLANGWPPYWERLPGPYQVAGDERSVDSLEIDSAQWAAANLGPGNTFATDSGDFDVLGSYGDQNPISNIAYLYTSPALTASDIQQAADQQVRYVLVDSRLSQALPASGYYFSGNDPGNYTRPLPLADLTKFDHIPDVARIYDSGDIVIYHLGEIDYAG